MKFLPATAALLLFVTCGSTAGEQKAGTYHSPEIGWTVRVPAGWTEMTKEEAAALIGSGLEAFEQTNGELDVSGLKALLSLKRDPLNSFLSTIETLDSGQVEAYDAFQYTLHEMLYNTFSDQGIRVDTSSGTEVVQGMDFNIFNTTVHAPNGEVIMQQSMYSRMYKGYDFGVTLSYNDEAARDTMLAVLRGSRFEE
ncbi:MAG: hypothetical protein ABI599_15570 [Flavobacteriales bacterium]